MEAEAGPEAGDANPRCGHEMKEAATLTEAALNGALVGSECADGQRRELAVSAA